MAMAEHDETKSYQICSKNFSFKNTLRAIFGLLLALYKFITKLSEGFCLQNQPGKQNDTSSDYLNSSLICWVTPACTHTCHNLFWKVLYIGESLMFANYSQFLHNRHGIHKLRLWRHILCLFSCYTHSLSYNHLSTSILDILKIKETKYMLADLHQKVIETLPLWNKGTIELWRFCRYILDKATYSHIQSVGNWDNMGCRKSRSLLEFPHLQHS